MRSVMSLCLCAVLVGCVGESSEADEQVVVVQADTDQTRSADVKQPPPPPPVEWEAETVEWSKGSGKK